MNELEQQRMKALMEASINISQAKAELEQAFITQQYQAMLGNKEWELAENKLVIELRKIDLAQAKENLQKLH